MQFRLRAEPLGGFHSHARNLFGFRLRLEPNRSLLRLLDFLQSFFRRRGLRRCQLRAWMTTRLKK